MRRPGSRFVNAGSSGSSGLLRLHGRFWMVLLLLSLPGCSDGTPPESVASDIPQAEERVRDVLRTWLNSQIRGELEPLGEVYAEDAVVMPPGRPPLSGREAILSDLRQTLAEAELQLSYTSDSRLIREDLSVERGRLVRAVHPRTGGPPTAESLNLVTVMLREQDGKWRIQWQAWNSNLPAASSR